MRGPRATSVGWLGLLLLAVALFALPAAAQGAVVAPAPHSVAAPLPALPREALTVPLAPANAVPDGGAVPASQFLGLSFAFQAPTTQVNSLLKAEQTPGSGVYHEYATPQEYDAMFAPPSALVEAVQGYFEGYGFQMTYDPAGSYHLFGTAADANAAFGTTLVYYKDGNNRYWAPTTAPTLPSQYAAALGSVVGLNTQATPSYLPLTPSLTAPVSTTPANPASSVRPHALTVTFTNTIGDYYSLYGGTTPIFVPPVGQNVSVTATVTGGAPTPVAPCTWTWTFGDGTSTTNTSDNCTSFAMYHEYKQAFNAFTTGPDYLNVTVVDSTGAAYGSYQAQVIPSMSAQWMSRFYGALQMDDHGKAGAGMTIGLNEMCDPNLTNGTAAVYSADVGVFSTAMGLPAANIVYVGPGYPACDTNWGYSGWSGETLLDMEWAHAMAPNATIEVYFGIDGSNMPWENMADLDGGDAYWANDLGSGVWIDSNSWGLEESTGYYSLYENTWAQGAAEGLSFFSSSGDCGSADGNLEATGATNVTPGVNFPADSPYGVGVGGTIMQTTPNGTFVNEYVWNGTYSNTTCENNEGTGGGWSCVFSQPGFQALMPGQDPGWNFIGSTWACPVPGNYHPRGIPDVSADAATWADTYEGGEWLPIGGTSLASPMWAAMMTVSLSYLGDITRPVGLLDNQLYAIGQGNHTYVRDFHDITSGDNCNTVASCTAPFSATYMWDAATGWGSPNLWNLTNDLNGSFPSYYEVSGQVLNGATLAPIPGATVFSGAAKTVSTAPNGDWSMYFIPGSHTIDATATGFAQGSIGVLVNSTDQSGVNILLWSNVGTVNSTEVVGKLISQVDLGVGYGLVDAYRYCSNPPTPPGPCPGVVGSSGSSPGGNFTLFLQPGLYFLIGSAPGFNNSGPVEIVVGSLPVIDVIVQIDFIITTVEGQVLSINGHVPVWGATVQGTSFPGGSWITAQTTSSTAGQFFLHLPAGVATFTASAPGYGSDSIQLTIYQNGLDNVLLLLTPSGARTSQVTIAMHVIDPDHTPSGLPLLASGNSTELEVWANNSISGFPQIGIYLQFVDSANGAWSAGDNITVGGSPGAPASWAPGEAFINYTAPFLGSAAYDQVNAQVLTPGWSGSGSTEMYLTPYYLSCAQRVCQYEVWGVVVAPNGQRLVNAQVQISTPGGGLVGTATSNANGIYSLSLVNGTYLARPSLAGYQAAPLTPFTVNGAPAEVDLSLNPIPPPLTPAEQQAYNANNNLFSVDTWAIVPFLALAMALIAVAAIRFLMPSKDEEDKTPVFGQTPAAPEAQLFPGGEGQGPPLPPGQDAGAGGGALPEATPPDTPWEITPAPPPPPPDTGGTGGMGDDSQGGGDDGGAGAPPAPDGADPGLFPPPEPPSGP